MVDGLVERLAIVDDRLAAVQLADGRSIARDAVFIRPALHAHRDGLLASLGCKLDEAGFASVDANRARQPSLVCGSPGTPAIHARR